MVLDRYIFRLWAGPFIGFLFIVTGILLLGRALKLLAMFTDKGVDWSIMFTMLAAVMPYFLLITVPIAFFFALQSMFLKLYQGSEMDAFRASGISFLRLLRSIIVVSLLLWLALTMTSLQWMPEGQKSFLGLLAAIQKAKPAPSFDPQRFNRDMEDFTVYVDGQDEEGRLIGFMLEDARSDIPVIYLAERAEIGKSSSGLTFSLYRGARLEGSMGNQRSLSFEEYQVSINLGAMGLLKVPVWRAHVLGMGAVKLWQAAFHEKRLDAIAELSRRLLLPTTVIVFLFFCLPLSIVPKRSGSAGSYIIGTVLILMIYNVQIVLHQQVTGENLPWWSMWMGQLFFFIVAFWAFRRASQDRLPSLLLFIEGVASIIHQRILHLTGHRSDIRDT
ncbi:MAG: LptF/LptG family permease [Mariprofundaceae bacterium]